MLRLVWKCHLSQLLLPKDRDAVNSQQLALLQLSEELDKLLKIMSHLRDPDKGCPWDIQQTNRDVREILQRTL